jgi:hypothetical protein
MSTVVSAIKGNTIHMCGDTAGYCNGTLSHCKKVQDGGDYLLGTVGSRDPFLAMYYDFSLPAGRGISRRDYIAGPLRSALKSILCDMERDSFSLHLGFFYQGVPCLIVMNGGVSSMEEVVNTEWSCLGHGKELAMGVMDTLWDTDISTRALLEKAIETASRYDAYTALPSEYLCLTA